MEDLGAVALLPRSVHISPRAHPLDERLVGCDRSHPPSQKGRGARAPRSGALRPRITRSSSGRLSSRADGGTAAQTAVPAHRPLRSRAGPPRPGGRAASRPAGTPAVPSQLTVGAEPRRGRRDAVAPSAGHPGRVMLRRMGTWPDTEALDRARVTLRPSEYVPGGCARRRPRPERGHADRDEDAGDVGPELGCVACWRVDREPGRPFFVHAGEVVRVGQQDPDLHDVGEGCAGGLQDGLAVRERLAGLLLDGWAGRLAGGDVNPDEAETEMWPPALIPWLYSGERGASGVLMTWRMCSTIASRAPFVDRSVHPQLPRCAAVLRRVSLRVGAVQRRLAMVRAVVVRHALAVPLRVTLRECPRAGVRGQLQIG